MTKKIIGICGSPRQGNSEFLLRTVLEEVGKGGTETELVLIREKNIALCDGCLTCAGGKAPFKIQNDDMKDIYQKIKKADIIILASPIWYDMVTPHTVNFIDRLNPIQNDLKRKGLAFILAGQLTGEEAEESQSRAISYLKQIAKLYEMSLIGFVSAKGVKDKGDAKNREDIIKKCRELGDSLME